MCHPPQTPPSFHETRLLWRPRINDGGFGGTGTVRITRQRDHVQVREDAAID
jgi:hypothetical protein